MEKKEFADKLMNLFLESAEENAREKGMSEDEIKIRSEKFKIIGDQVKLENELRDYTHNSYCGITTILNEHYKKVNELLKETIAKCKKFLDDNNLPYEEEESEEDED